MYYGLWKGCTTIKVTMIQASAMQQCKFTALARPGKEQVTSWHSFKHNYMLVILKMMAGSEEVPGILQHFNTLPISALKVTWGAKTNQ